MGLQTLRELLPKEKLRGRPQKYPVSRASGTLWPHGEFSLGYAKQRPDDDERLGDFSYVAPGLGPDGQALEEPLPLDLSDAPNSHKPAKRGLKGITGYGRQMIKAAGFLMGNLFPQHRKTFATVTLPPMSESERVAVVDHWSELLRQLLQWLARRCSAAGVPELVCSVSEIQPERLLESGEGYLHLHLLWLNIPAKKDNWTVEPNDLRAWVTSFLSRVCGINNPGYVNVDVKRVHGDAARYMAKYMSKGGQLLVEALEDWGENCCPSTWWNMTKLTRDAVKSRTHKGFQVGSLLEEMVNFAFNTDVDEMFAYIRHIDLEFDGVMHTVGYRGRFQENVRDDLTDMLQSAQTARR